MNALHISIVIAAAIAAPGCIPQDVGCNSDMDCSSGAECANTHECLGPNELMRVELRWTIDGVEPSPNDVAPCTGAGIAKLTVTYIDNDTADAPQLTTYDPVPCSLARSVYTKMPTWYDAVELGAWDADGLLITSEQADLTWPETIAIFDLQP